MIVVIPEILLRFIISIICNQKDYLYKEKCIYDKSEVNAIRRWLIIEKYLCELHNAIRWWLIVNIFFIKISRNYKNSIRFYDRPVKLLLSIFIRDVSNDILKCWIKIYKNCSMRFCIMKWVFNRINTWQTYFEILSWRDAYIADATITSRWWRCNLLLFQRLKKSMLMMRNKIVLNCVWGY